MALTFTLKGKDFEIKFNYALLFKANKQLATKDDNGNNQGNGALTLLQGLMQGNDDTLRDFVRLASGKKTLSDDEFAEIVENYIENEYDGDEDKGYPALFEDTIDEMLESGFFKGKIQNQLDQSLKGFEMLSKQSTVSEEQKSQIEVGKAFMDEIKSRIS